ncbi:unnamed protein product [Bursaphelenchus okinawaensis]|uniref:Uncharacterized protein n=1 Tax=Bursaphelenchus okinawaensis TaxID=465554 RepID=A0A811LQL3_9BILA|nr:unnamed protein product [Bursaphelenchus okinawaensis]CAG9127840.1 unnamed protein product [Bursaphelenchus okinawaensis]
MLNKYRWYLMNSVIWSFAFNTMSTFSGTITLFPLPCYYGINIASRLHGNYQIAYFFVTVNCLTCKCVAVAMQIEHRFNCTLSRNSLWCRLVSGSVRYEVCFRIGIYVACFLITNKTTIYLDEPGAELLDSESLIPSDPTIVPFSKTNVITPVDSKNDDNNQKSLQSVTTFSPDSRFNMDNIRRSMENIKNNLDSIKFTDSSKQPYPSLPYEYTSKYEKLPLPPELPNSRLLPLSEFHLGGSEVSDFGMYWSKTSGNDEQLRQGKRFEYIPEKISRNKNGEYKIDVKEGRFEEREGSIRARAVIVNRDGQPHFSVDLKLIINEIQMRRRIYHVREFNVDDRLMRIAKELAIDILASRRIQLNNRDANVWIGGSNIDHAKVVDEWCREMAASKQNYFKSRDFYSVGVGMASDDHDEKLTVVVSVYE